MRWGLSKSFGRMGSAFQAAAQFSGERGPQRLKPSSVYDVCGTAEAVPFVQRLFPQLAGASSLTSAVPPFARQTKDAAPTAASGGGLR